MSYRYLKSMLLLAALLAVSGCASFTYYAQSVGGHDRAAPAKQRKENPMNYYLIRKVAALTVAALAFLYYVLSLDLTLVKSLDLTASLFP